MDLPDKEIPIAPGNLGVCNVDHVLWEKAEVVGWGGVGADGEEGHLVCSHFTESTMAPRVTPVLSLVRVGGAPTGT